jgi:Homing endonuclease/SNF2-related domain
MTETTTARPSVEAVLRAVGRGALHHLVQGDTGRLLAGYVARVEAGVELTDTEQRAAARLLQESQRYLAGPLAQLGMAIPDPPAPVTRTEPSHTSATLECKLWTLADGKIGIIAPFAMNDTIKGLSGWAFNPARKCWTIPATPASAAAALETLSVTGYRATAGVLELAQSYVDAQAARSLLADGAPAPEHDYTDVMAMPLWTHQRRAVAYAEVAQAMLVAVKMGGGKRLSVQVPIPTPSGWTCMGDLVAGDEVFDDRGEVCRVTIAHPVTEDTDAYELEFSDGARIVADAEHLWFTHTRSDRVKWTYHRARGTICPPTGAVRTTAEIAATLDVGKHHAGGRPLVNHSIPLAGALRLPDVELPIPPYLLGQWLGNGQSTTGLLCVGGARVNGEYRSDGAEVREMIAADSFTCGPNIEGRRDRAETFTVYGLVGHLRAAGVLGHKHIPPAYLRASEKQRRALLAGLLDTDGTVCAHGRVQFDSTTRALAEGVRELAASLGYRPTWQDHRAKLDGVDHGPSYRVSFTTADPVFRLTRKARAHEARSVNYHEGRNAHRYIVAARRIPSVPMRCITVDSPSSLYLAGEAMIPTHNTGIAIAAANRVQARTVLIVCPNRVRAVWPREVRERSAVSWHISDGTRAPARRGARRQDLSQPERVALCNELFYDCRCGAPVHAFVINYEALDEPSWQRWLPQGKIDLIIYDEAHRLKNPQLKAKVKRKGKGPAEAALPPDATDEPRERALGPDAPRAEILVARAHDKREARQAEQERAGRLTRSGVAARWVQWSHRRMALTGTPFPQHPWDIFGLYRAVDPGIFGLEWKPFAETYVQMDKTGTFPVRIKKTMMREFADRCMTLMYRPRVDLNLPGCTDIVRPVELEPAARRSYDELDQALWTDLAAHVAAREAASALVDGEEVLLDPADLAEFDGGMSAELTARNVLSRLLRLQQLTGGTLRADPVKDGQGRPQPGPVARVSRAKAVALAEVLEEFGCSADRPEDEREPVVVFTRFTSDLDAVIEVAAKAGLRYAEVSGRRSDGLDPNARMNPDADVVGVNIQAGGTGVDLTRSRYAVWYSLGYSVSDYDQARARLYRPGQTRPVVYVHLIATDTQDQAVYDAIRARRAAVAAVLLAGGVDPAEVGLSEPDPGPDPNAEDVEGIDSSGTAVPLPWEQ